MWIDWEEIVKPFALLAPFDEGFIITFWQREYMEREKAEHERNVGAQQSAGAY